RLAARRPTALRPERDDGHPAECGRRRLSPESGQRRLSPGTPADLEGRAPEAPARAVDGQAGRGDGGPGGGAEGGEPGPGRFLRTLARAVDAGRTGPHPGVPPGPGPGLDAAPALTPGTGGGG